MIKIQGKVQDRRPDGSYVVEVEKNGKTARLVCYVSGQWKYRYRKLRIEQGDKVLVELSLYEKGKGKIIRKLR